MVSTSAISASQEQRYTAADVDEDGYLTETEFENAFPSEDFSAYDANNDGKVSKEEYTELILENNRAMAQTIWSMAMKIFGLDKQKKVDLGLEEFTQ